MTDFILGLGIFTQYTLGNLPILSLRSIRNKPSLYTNQINILYLLSFVPHKKRSFSYNGSLTPWGSIEISNQSISINTQCAGSNSSLI